LSTRRLSGRWKHLIICPDRNLFHGLTGVLGELTPGSAFTDLKVYPARRALTEAVNSEQPNLCFLDVGSSWDAAVTVINELSSMTAPIPVIAISAGNDPDIILRSLRQGASEFLFQPFAIECELEVGIPSPLEHTKTFLFDNERRDFTERDRALLNLLQPHLIQLYKAAAVRRLADTARAVVEDGGEERGVVVLAKTGAIEMASPLARRLLDAYFPRGRGARLPRVIGNWLRQQPMDRPPNPLSVDGPRGALTIELDRRGGTRVLLLEEFAAGGQGPAALSAREREVLALVRDGLRNAEIAEALWVSPATVRKHLENIYEKLDVHTRTAAVARVHGPG